MILMATCRRIRNGEYSDEEQAGYNCDYLSGHLNGAVGADGFAERTRRAFRDALLREMHRLRDEEDVRTPKVGIYLHGYNNDYQDSIDELVDLHRELAKVIKYNPILIGFSWPSSGRATDYLMDREEARDSVPAFVRFLHEVNDFLVENRRDCFATAFCVAHSMGNYLLRKGMEYLSDSLGTPEGRMLFSETVMLAPDLSSWDMHRDGKGRYIADFSRRVHVYYSKHDRALKASSAKRFGGHRLGRHGPEHYELLPPNVVVVRAEKYANSSAMKDILDRRGKQVSVHSAQRYHPAILADVERVLSSVDRDLIETRTPVRQGDGTSEPIHSRALYELI